MLCLTEMIYFEKIQINEQATTLGSTLLTCGWTWLAIQVWSLKSDQSAVLYLLTQLHTPQLKLCGQHAECVHVLTQWPVSSPIYLHHYILPSWNCAANMPGVSIPDRLTSQQSYLLTPLHTPQLKLCGQHAGCVHSWQNDQSAVLLKPQSHFHPSHEILVQAAYWDKNLGFW